jgi:hemerythrin-like metal-binding protein
MIATVLNAGAPRGAANPPPNPPPNLPPDTPPAAIPDLGLYQVGYEPMDEIHREFHELLTALAQPGDEGEKLLALHEHLLHHCHEEERWMTESRFPSCACHRQEHAILLDVVAEVRRRFDAGDGDVVQRFAAELPGWFQTHANEMDAALALHLRTFRREGALA